MHHRLPWHCSRALPAHAYVRRRRAHREKQTREGNFDVGLLNELKDFFKDCGKIEIRKNTARYIVKDLKSINEKVIPLLDKLNLQDNLFYEN